MTVSKPRVLAAAFMIGALTAIPLRAVTGGDLASSTAMETVTAYSKAYMRLDVETVSKLSHPIMVARAGGEQAYKDRVRDLFATFKPFDFEKGGEELGAASEMFVDGQTLMVGIPAIRKAPGLPTSPFVYVAVSYNSGKAWSVLGLQCTDEKWLKGLAPNYTGHPDILGRKNPAVIALESGGNLDEATFLRRPRSAGRSDLKD